MGIYIKGMEMPKNGLYQIVDGTIRLYDYRKIIDDKEKDTQSYNIIEIKEPHGRLIDADAVMRKNLFTERDRGFLFDAPTVIEGSE